jgi:hypothetical protein
MKISDQMFKTKLNDVEKVENTLGISKNGSGLSFFEKI